MDVVVVWLRPGVTALLWMQAEALSGARDAGAPDSGRYWLTSNAEDHRLCGARHGPSGEFGGGGGRMH